MIIYSTRRDCKTYKFQTEIFGLIYESFLVIFFEKKIPLALVFFTSPSILKTLISQFNISLQNDDLIDLLID